MLLQNPPPKVHSRVDRQDIVSSFIQPAALKLSLMKPNHGPNKVYRERVTGWPYHHLHLFKIHTNKEHKRMPTLYWHLDRFLRLSDVPAALSQLCCWHNYATTALLTPS